ncbi:MAG: dockerin type I repeat-containing protein [Clostridia bacterium]|nr:dockerin type I repeat-containing protein [Clostridia bacterium]
MKKSSVKFISVISAVILLLQIAVIFSEAYQLPELKVALKAEENGKYTVSLYISSPNELSAIDFSIIFKNKGYTFDGISIIGTDSEKFKFNSDNIHTEYENSNTYFTHNYSHNNEALKYSGYFIDYYSADKDFYLCDIMLKKSTASKTDKDIEINYSIETKSVVNSSVCKYSIANGNEINNDFQKAYQLGDANGDGKVQASDARSILRNSVNLEEIPVAYFPYADADHNGIISAIDARYSLRASVDLENEVFHLFEISLLGGSDCENGGSYQFYCLLSSLTYSAELKGSEHIFTTPDCITASQCIICSKTAEPALNHKFDDTGLCSVCDASKTENKLITQELYPVFESINHYDTLAHDAALNDDLLSFIKYTQSATLNIKDALDICSDINGMQTVRDNLQKAYKIRFSSFIHCMDSNGNISLTRKNYNYISDAVNFSNKYLDYASYSINI